MIRKISIILVTLYRPSHCTKKNPCKKNESKYLKVEVTTCKMKSSFAVLMSI